MIYPEIKYYSGIVTLFLILNGFLAEISYVRANDINIKAVTNTSSDSGNIVSVKLVPEIPDISGIQNFRIGLHMDITDGWHVYWRNPGDSGYSTHIRWMEHGHYQPGEIQWPTPSRFDEDGITTYGYSENVTLLIPFYANKNHTGSVIARELTFSAEVNWLVCKEFCISESVRVELKTDRNGFFSTYSDEDVSYIEQTVGLLPETNRNWHVEGYHRDDRIYLQLTPENTNAIIPSNDSIYFFPYSRSIIDHTAQQHIFRDENKLVIELVPSRYGRPGIRDTAGIIVAPGGWKRSGKSNAMEIRFTIH